MAKGNRKRTNKVSQKKTTPKKKSTTAVPSVMDTYPVKTLNQMHSEMIKEMFNLSNRVGKLINQQQMKYKQISQGDLFMKQIKEGKIKLPLLVQKGAKVFAPMDDKQAIIDDIASETKIIQESINITEGQLSHWYDEYVASLTRVYYMLDNILGENKNINDVSGHIKVLGQSHKEEEKNFIQSFDLDKPEEVEKAKKAVKKAVKKNAGSTGKSGKKDS